MGDGRAKSVRERPVSKELDDVNMRLTAGGIEPRERVVADSPKRDGCDRLSRKIVESHLRAVAALRPAAVVCGHEKGTA